MNGFETILFSEVPAPLWFLFFFKVLGFALHLLMMNLWLVALPMALYCGWRGSTEAKAWGARLGRQMPFIVAFGINFGIVPLLFMQVLYPRAFYPATVLMAWFWIGIIVALIPAYYGIYIYAGALRKNPNSVSRAAGWAGRIAAGLLILIGIVFVNALVLTSHPQLWHNVWLAHETAGAATGFGLPPFSGMLCSRLGLMVGLALGTTSVWVLADRAFFWKDATPACARWTAKFARRTAFLGLLVFGLSGGHYLLAGIGHDMTSHLLSHALPAVICAALGPITVFLAVFGISLKRKISKIDGLIVFLCGFLSLAANAIARQILQVNELHEFQPLTELKVYTELSPIALFLGTFILGAGVIVWMIWKTCKNQRISG